MKKIRIMISLVAITILMGFLCMTKCYGICFWLRIEGEESVGEGENIQLEAIYDVGNDLGDNQGILSEEYVTDEAIWISSDESVAKVENGNVFGVQIGTATITAIYTDGDLEREASIEIEVTSNYYIDNENDETCSPVNYVEPMEDEAEETEIVYIPMEDETEETEIVYLPMEDEVEEVETDEVEVNDEENYFLDINNFLRMFFGRRYIFFF